jgi:glycosyltransferase involved in cell wall biosynthesis
VRILFVSGTTVGGSGRSQRELAARLAGHGHEVLFLVDLERGERAARWLYEQLADVRVRWGARAGGGLVRWLEDRPGHRPGRTEIGGVDHLTSPVPENALARVLESFRPDVVVGSSMVRLAWRKAVEICRARGVPTVLYVREVEALNHFEAPSPPVDEVVANAESLCAQVKALGVHCTTFPSVVETGVTRVESSRVVALAVNPIESRGVHTVLEMAKQLPEVPFVLQESWPLTPEQLASVQRHVAELPNVELRRSEPPGPGLYRDARVLLVPYRVDNRPRVIPEAQANGIPVIVADSPALAEATGSGGVVVDMDDVEAWCSAVRSMWTDDARYEALCHAALRHSRRASIDPAVVASEFEAFLIGLVSRR